MTIANLGWGIDTSTWMLIPMGETGAIDLAAISNHAAGTGPGTLSGGGLSTYSIYGGGVGKWWGLGAAASFTFGALPSNTLSSGTSSVWTVEALVLKTNAVVNEIGLWDFRPSTGSGTAPFFLRIEPSGGFRIRIITTSTTYDVTTPAYFPKANEQHVRLVYDFAAGNAKLYCGDAGTVPTLFYTLTTDTNPLSGSSMGALFVGNGDDSGMGRLRVSTAAMTDAYPSYGGVSPPITVLGATMIGGRVVVTFSDTILDTAALRTASNYVFTPPGGAPTPIVTDFVVGSNTVSLGLSTYVVNGGTYTLSIASNTARSSVTGAGNTAASPTFTGVSSPPTIVSTVSPLISVVQVVFSKAMDTASATNPTNYTISGGVTVKSVTKISDSIFQLSTSGESPGSSYTLTCSSAITDTLGNPLV